MSMKDLKAWALVAGVIIILANVVHYKPQPQGIANQVAAVRSSVVYVEKDGRSQGPPGDPNIADGDRPDHEDTNCPND